MLIHWFPLLCGLIFGLIPPRLLINTECRYLRFDALWNRVLFKETGKQRRRRWWKLPLVWVDPLRGYVTASMLSDAFHVAPMATGILKVLPLVTTFLALTAVLWVQTTGRREQRETLSPCGFLGGMMLALLPVMVSVSAIVMGVAAAIALRRFVAGYVLAACATAGIGYLFMGRSPWLGAYTVLVATPLLISWFARKSLVIPVRS
jgi:hypothetical protein